ncbi:rRNA maturation RNase YbeY [Modestobacter altitudinis]|uniref:rRNA maturation RNase YbeY n=1 Tax=Modestobacter altitudinis TaxID=2213158 RepID=UPI00110C9CC3|nr:rRNA maturation RNase YbeY [Modestobacter altitudinis]
MPVEVANESEIAVDTHALAGVCRYVLDSLDVSPLAELSVLCVDVDYMASLHERWMGEKGPTDVLAFPMDELDTARPDDPDPGPALLGDVVLCPAVAVRQARAAGHSMADELLLLATHGVLHLLGYDHMEPEEEKEMFGLQSSLLEGFRSIPREAVTGEPVTSGPVTGEPVEPGAR